MSGGDRTPRRRGRRALDAEERALWQYVTRSVHRLHPEPVAPLAAAPEPEKPSAPETKASRPVVAVASMKPLAPPAPPPLAPLEPKLRRKLARGSEVDARLDLHGLTQQAAHRRLHAFLLGAQGAGHSLVLVITGKGGVAGSPISGFMGGEERGVLRRMVPQWLSQPEMRGLVVGFETAARGHGGEGALYVRIRRNRGRA